MTRRLLSYLLMACIAIVSGVGGRLLGLSIVARYAVDTAMLALGLIALLVWSEPILRVSRRSLRGVGDPQTSVQGMSSWLSVQTAPSGWVLGESPPSRSSSVGTYHSGYPVTFEADYVERRSRLTTFFRLLLVIPVAIVLYVFGIVASSAIVIAWFAIVITGRYPKGLYDFVADFNRFVARVTAYGVLLTDAYPPFSGGDDPAYPIRMSFAGPLEHYSRLKTLFRGILAIPILVLRYVLGLLLEIGAVASWFVILFTGKMPRGLFDLMMLVNSYTARSDAYLFLLAETYPPFEDDLMRSAGTSGPTIEQASFRG